MVLLVCCHPPLNIDDGSILTLISNQFTGNIYEDNNDNFWTSSQGPMGWEVIRYDINSIFNHNLNATKIWTDTGMTVVIEKENAGLVWFGILDGICQYDGITVNCLNGD